MLENINRDTNRKIIFLAARGDKMVKYTNAEELFEAYKGQKQMILFDGTHLSDRPPEVLNQIFAFIEEMLFSVHSTIKKN